MNYCRISIKDRAQNRYYICGGNANEVFDFACANDKERDDGIMIKDKLVPIFMGLAQIPNSPFIYPNGLEIMLYNAGQEA